MIDRECRKVVVRIECCGSELCAAEPWERWWKRASGRPGVVDVVDGVPIVTDEESRAKKLLHPFHARSPSLDRACRLASTSTSAAGEARDDDVKDGDDSVDDSFEGGADGVDDSHQGRADGPEYGRDLALLSDAVT